MKAIILTTAGGPENFLLAELPKPVPGPGEVLIRIAAISINPIDWKTRSGKGAWPLVAQIQPLVLGWDVSGVIESVGPDAGHFLPGDSVFGMVNYPGSGGCYAGYVTAPASQLAKKPEHISHGQAAATTLAALTAWDALFTHGHLASGQKVLIHAAAGGVGHFAVQLAKNAGAHVAGTASAEKADFLRGLGIDEHVDYKNEDFSTRVQDVDLVVDTIGGDTFDRSLKTLKPGGLIVTLPSGYVDDPAGKAAAGGRRGIHVKVSASATNMQHLAALLENGKLIPHIDREFSLEQMADAHRELQKGRTTGKIILYP
ncbi:oxidoreductase [Pedobacter yulinensis]|uniref:Oxidoreductase n=1 Tax=Pedobacter yulinensis TaxID=2126353 RepID=A0A2T3HNE2_9SPHI|nr:NADP-dependent oxidoreductase [Pedobacter yulinensis]PST83972.1 oxidoreductase [Pedobacter yulinensis]